MLDLQEITSRVIREVGTETLQRAESMKPDEVEENGSLEFFDGGFVIKYNEEMTAYFEFRTGEFSKSYLADKPQEVKDEAMKFFKNGKGTIQGQPFIFPALLWALDETTNRIEREVLSVWNNLRF